MEPPTAYLHKSIRHQDHSRRKDRRDTSVVRSSSPTSTPSEALTETLHTSYATARDEFEIAQEETEKKTVYAADDRVAAHEELNKLKAAFAEAVAGEGGGEIQRRVGGRLRELERAVAVMDELAMED